MRLLLVSDLHYTLKQFDWLHTVASDYQVVVIAGDHLDISSVADVDMQIVVIKKYLKRLTEKTRLLVSSGNHDLTGRNATGERVALWLAGVRELGVVVDGDAVDVGGMLVTVCPWWDGPLSRNDVGALLARDAARPKRDWIWVYHAPPAASPVSWSGSKYFGDTDLSHWIDTYQPSIVLSGHIHQSPFRQGGSWVDRVGSTWVFNAGRQIGPCPTHVIVDTDERTASWFSLAGNQMVRLDEPLTRPVRELN